MKRSIRFLAIFIILSGLFSCDDDDPAPTPTPTPTPNLIYFKATLTGPVTGRLGNASAINEALLTYNDDTNTFKIIVEHNVSGATAAHIHTTDPVIPPATNNIVIPFPSAVSPINHNGTLDTNQEIALKAEKYYVNIHNQAYPGPLSAAISGVLLKQTSGGGGYPSY
jgi:hypothetical protein